MMSNLSIKTIIFISIGVVIYLIMPSFLAEELSKACVFTYVIGIVYIAFAGVDAYEFYIGDKFSIGIQMYRLKSLKEDHSNFNIWHRRIAIVIRMFLALIVFVALFSSWVCEFVP